MKPYQLTDAQRRSIWYRVGAMLGKTAGRICGRVDQLSFQPPTDQPVPVRQNHNRAARRAAAARQRHQLKRRNRHARHQDR